MYFYIDETLTNIIYFNKPRESALFCHHWKTKFKKYKPFIKITVGFYVLRSKHHFKTTQFLTIFYSFIMTLTRFTVCYLVLFLQQVQVILLQKNSYTLETFTFDQYPSDFFLKHSQDWRYKCLTLSNVCPFSDAIWCI